MATHKFPKQDKPGLDLVMADLYKKFGSNSLIVHDAIVKVMEENKIPLEDEKTRKLLSQMAIELTNQMSNYDF